MSALIGESFYHIELIDGEGVQKPLPKKPHALIQKFLLLALNRDLPDIYEVLPELNMLCGKDRLVPDLTVVRCDARYQDGDLADPAIFAVEILSPGQRLPDLMDRADRMIRSGTRVCWIIWPEAHKAWMYMTGDMVEATHAISATLPDGGRLDLDVAEMWRKLEPL